jgi:hypothetical protein
MPPTCCPWHFRAYHLSLTGLDSHGREMLRILSERLLK